MAKKRTYRFTVKHRETEVELYSKPEKMTMKEMRDRLNKLIASDDFQGYFTQAVEVLNKDWTVI